MHRTDRLVLVRLHVGEQTFNMLLGRSGWHTSPFSFLCSQHTQHNTSFVFNQELNALTTLLLTFYNLNGAAGASPAAAAAASPAAAAAAATAVALAGASGPLEPLEPPHRQQPAPCPRRA